MLLRKMSFLRSLNYSGIIYTCIFIFPVALKVAHNLICLEQGLFRTNTKLSQNG